ncbi:hypothetical protein N7465_008218 [Penicillium sp. CMV-2018d]|nr:hypothetical protein N7465_008218 [Penicillium sp. CMV-2018d]
MSLLSLPNELLLSILSELDVEDVISLLETDQDLYQISFQCLKNRHLDLRPYCTVGNRSRVQLLLEAGAKTDSPSYSSGSPLFHAAVNGHEEVVKLLLQHGAQIGHNVNSALCPLRAAAKEGYFTIVKLMLDYGVDLSDTDLYEFTALDETIEYKGQYSYYERGPWKRLKLCLHRNPGTPFSYYETLKLLLESQVYVEISDGTFPHTALHTALASYPHLQHDTVGLLLRHLSNPNARNHEGKTPLHLLDPNKPGYDPGCTEIAKLLLDHGADIGAQDLNGATPLHIAASSDTKGETITALYLAYEANVNAVNFEGNTPLHLAVSKEGSTANVTIIKLLLESGAHVNATTDEGNTPLHLAVDNHAANDVFELLFQYGGDWNRSNGEPSVDTPLKKMADLTGDALMPR